MDTIILPPFEELSNLFKNNGTHLRLGQWFVNNYTQNCKDCVWLFYEIDDTKSLETIKKKFYS